MVAENPNSCRAYAVFNTLLGLAFGLVASQAIVPAKPVSFAISWTRVQKLTRRHQDTKLKLNKTPKELGQARRPVLLHILVGRASLRDHVNSYGQANLCRTSFTIVGYATQLLRMLFGQARRPVLQHHNALRIFPSLRCLPHDEPNRRSRHS